MRKAKGRNQLIKKLQEINEHIIVDLIVDNFNEHLLNNAFKVDTTLSLSYSDRIIYITKNILSGNEKYLNTLINYNNTYITENGYDKLTEKEYEEKCLNNEIRSLTGSGINAEQMILYIMTTGRLKEKLDFFKKLYRQDLESYNVFEKDTLNKKPEMLELLQGTQFEMEFQEFINNNYKGFDKIDFEGLADRYRIKYNKFNDTYTVPSGFVVFFENKTMEIFNKLESFNLNFGLLHGNLKRIDGYLRNIEKIQEESKRTAEESKTLKAENENLKKVNEFQKAKILAYESGEKDKLIKESQKEITYLYGQIERLKEEINNIEQDENNTIEENIKIEEIEQQKEKEKTDLQNKNIIVLGGKWNSKNKGEVESYIDAENATVEFIEANRIFRNSQKISNKDIVIFDTSYNSHAAFYKIKSIARNIIYINKSNIEEIKKSL
jgi:hypothetical protein F3_00292|nr:MAG TPA: protein of unknown function (DUF2325) [Caudoviricetes sp.]